MPCADSAPLALGHRLGGLPDVARAHQKTVVSSDQFTTCPPTKAGGSLEAQPLQGGSSCLHLSRPMLRRTVPSRVARIGAGSADSRPIWLPRCGPCRWPLDCVIMAHSMEGSLQAQGWLYMAVWCVAAVGLIVCGRRAWQRPASRRTEAAPDAERPIVTPPNDSTDHVSRWRT